MRRVVILMSDTGGGHRSAAEAIVAALDRQFPGRYASTLFDVFKQAAIFPFHFAPNLYLPFTKYFEPLWALLFLTTNNRLSARFAIPFIKFIIGKRLKKFLRDQSPDIVVSVHPVFVQPARKCLREIDSRAPFVTVVTDLFDAHLLWFDPDTDVTVVPTDGAHAMGLRYGMPAEKLRIIGEPVSLNFLDAGLSQRDARTELGLAPDYATILLVGGGEGMGPLDDIARAIDDARVNAQLAIITGRNELLQRQLEMMTWQMPVRVEGFVTNMPDWMRAADVIITKAGPGTISEALACGLPILLSGFLPGQEAGNVTFVEQSGVGVLREKPEDIASTLNAWLAPGNDTLARLAQRARELARPCAALDIAQMLDELVTR